MHFQTSQMKGESLALIAATLAMVFASATPMALAQSHYDELAGVPFNEGYIAKDNVPVLLDESFFQRAVQTYLWALPALNMYGMKEGSEKIFGKGYNVLPIFKDARSTPRHTPRPGVCSLL